jgi:hypothetical protein
MITPREIIRDFLTLLNIIRDNPNADFVKLTEKQTAAESSVSVTDSYEQKNVPEQKTEAKPVKKTINLFDIDI